MAELAKSLWEMVGAYGLGHPNTIAAETTLRAFTEKVEATYELAE